MKNVRWTEYEKRALANAAYQFYADNPNISLVKIINYAQVILPEHRRRNIQFLQHVPWFKRYIEDIELKQYEKLINNLPKIEINNKEDVEFITKFDLLEILNNFENKIITSIESSIKKTINSLNIPEVVSDYVLDEVSKYINIEPSKIVENQPSHKVNISNSIEGEVLHNVNVSIKKAVHEILDSGFLLNKDTPIISNIIEETITKSECLEIVKQIENEGLDSELNSDLYKKLINYYLKSNINKKIKLSLIGVYQDRQQFIRAECINPLFKNLIDIKIWNEGRSSNARTILKSMGRSADLTYVVSANVDHWVTDILKTLNNVTWILHPHGISSLKKEVELGIFKHMIQNIIDMDFK